MSLIIEIKVQPSSGRSVLRLDKKGCLKAYLKSPPEEGKANAELLKLIARELSCPQGSVRLIAGATFRTKRIELILPLSYEQLLTKLGLVTQTTLLAQK